MFTRRAIPSAFRAATRASTARPIPSARFLTPFQARLLSDEVRSAIDRAVASSPVVLFMKGTPETPQCGFSRASIQILGMQGVDPEKFTAFNVLEDQDLRQGIKEYSEWPTIPQLYVDKEFVGGCDILMSMHQDGSLAKMLEEKDASDEYRRHLYNTTSLNITKTLNSLLHNLYDSTLRTITPDSSQQNSNASPLRLSGPAKYERLATQLYQPISQFKLSLRRIDSRGKSVRFVQTLETRMLHYDELIAKETKKLGTLQKEWESVVSEIWKLGAKCLGDEAMAEMLFTEQGLYEKTLPLSSSPFKATDAEDTLFIPENDSFSPRYKPLVGKRRVTFLEEEEEAPGVCGKYDATPTDQFPDFIHQPSSDRNGTLPLIPDLSEGETKELEKMVTELGKQEMGDFCKIEEDHEAYWKKKTAQLANALKSD
ncbi:unnamed protein product [Alternaria alternata]